MVKRVTKGRREGGAVLWRAGRPHKAFVITTDETWREFRAVCVRKGMSVQDALGDMVAKAVTADKRAERAKTKRRAARSAEVKREARKLGVDLGG